MNTAESTNVYALVDMVAHELSERKRIPDATYRVQFSETFTFRDALAIVPYLHKLGISHLYASPIFKSRSGSTHGYDICDYTQFSPVLGTVEDFDTLIEALHANGMGLILDMVPNHMGIGDPCNMWWMDVLENGPASIYASYFDIDWEPVKPELRNKVLLPVLEDQYGDVLEAGKLQLIYESGAFTITYHESWLPVAPDTYAYILNELHALLLAASAVENDILLELESILTALSYLPLRSEKDQEKLVERNREKETIKHRLATLVDNSPDLATELKTILKTFNGNVGDPASFDRLDSLLEAQSYRPAFWRVAAEEINYRRFFDINDLAAIRVEVPEVFEATHDLIFRLLVRGQIDGLRIDHPDGLWSPARYFRRLQEGYVRACVIHRLGGETVDPEAIRQAVNLWFDNQNPTPQPLYVVVEKILSETEPLPQDWPVCGTTGYDFLNAANGLFVDSANERTFENIYFRFIRQSIDFNQLVHTSKQLIMRTSLISELNAVGHALERINEKNRRYRDFTLNGLISALREVIACLSIYRTYISAPDAVSMRDRHYIELAIQDAKDRSTHLSSSIFDFIRDTWLLSNMHQFKEGDRQNLIDFVMKFQQLTGPVMAKSVEDTSFYIYSRLVSLNEVGGDPRTFGGSVKHFHARNIEAVRCWPHSMLASSTHDTKRSEDVRARINVLSEIPGEWNAALKRWKRLNTSHRPIVQGQPAPDRNEEYLLYQTLLGKWPAQSPDSIEFQEFRESVTAYMLKAANEAKIHTSWINPNREYEAALQKFVMAILDEKRSKHFLEDITSFQHRIAFWGWLNALSQQALKLTAPGVPDIYQGTELWDLSLVDPDNRRSVDYEPRMTYLSGLGSQPTLETAQKALDDDDIESGLIKFYVTQRILAYRRDHAELFTEGDYVPLVITGDKQAHVLAFVRTYRGQSMIVTVPVLVIGLTESVPHPPIGADVWGNTRILLPEEYAQKQYTQLFTGERLAIDDPTQGQPSLSLGKLCEHFPMSVLIEAA